MICEYCGNTHDGKYGSGRFCRKECASGYSTQTKRSEINQKVSEKLKGRDTSTHNVSAESIAKRRNTLIERYGSCNTVGIHGNETKEKIRTALKATYHEKHRTANFSDLSPKQKRKRIYEEQKGCCLRCKQSEWLGEPINLELDHIDGNNKNDERINLRLLCPNCHSYTDTYRGKNAKQHRNEISDEQFIEALKTSKNIRHALVKLGISPYGGNYKRANDLIECHSIQFMPV
jgi:hypothetical protein